MSRMKVAIVGTGNRSLLYLDVIRRMPDQFEMVSMRFRTQEKAQRFHSQYGIPVTTSMDELYAAKPDFIVAVNNRPDVGKVVLDALDHGVPVLAETPPAESFAEIAQVWERVQSTGVKMLVAENYFAEPGFAAKMEAARRGLLGEVSAVTVSNTHEYHAVSVMRIFLGAMFERMKVIGNAYTNPLTVTQDKNNVPNFEGNTVPAKRSHIILEFENGKVGFYDFAIPQYWSAIRSRYFMVQGSRGEIKDDDIWYLDSHNRPMLGRFTNITAGGELMYIAMNGEILFENPYLGSGVQSVGVASMMMNMKEYLETGIAKYTLADGLQDTYITQLMLEAERKPYTVIESQVQPWQP